MWGVPRPRDPRRCVGHCPQAYDSPKPDGCAARGRTPTKEPGPGGIGSPAPVKPHRPEGRRPFLKGAGAKRQHSKSTAGWGAPISKHGQRRGAANLGERGSHCGGGGLGGQQGQQPQHETKTGPPHSGPDHTPHPQPHSGNGAMLTHCSQKNHGEFIEICQVQLEPISESTSAKRSLSLHFKDD